MFSGVWDRECAEQTGVATCSEYVATGEHYTDAVFEVGYVRVWKLG